MDKKQAPHLVYLDGLRALAALYVVLFHAGVCFPTGELSWLLRNVRRVLSFGHDAVAVFIVLSGYCLMIPAARRDGHVAYGVVGYFGRRAFRILPPYYVALLGSLLIVVAFPSLHARTGTIWDDTYPALSFGPIASHLALVHNFFPAWVHTINGPLWSVATEWQIYFFFPFVLLPVWRRSGAVPTVLFGFIVGCLPIWLAPSLAASSSSWYLGLFAFGMCAAGIGFSSRPQDQMLRERVAWRWVSLGFLALSCLGTTVLVKLWFRHLQLSDALVGATTATLLVHYTKYLQSGAQLRPLGLRLLESRWLVALGRFSYSLYLVHLPVVALCHFGLLRLHLSADAHTLGMLGLGTPLSVAVAYAFFLGIERRFLVHGAPKLGKASVAS